MGDQEGLLLKVIHKKVSFFACDLVEFCCNRSSVVDCPKIFAY